LKPRTLVSALVILALLLCPASEAGAQARRGPRTRRASATAASAEAKAALARTLKFKAGGCGKAISKPQPSYPAEARAAGAQGQVTVKILIGEDGRVASAEAVNGHPLLQEAAVEAARLARFSPVIVSGRPVKVESIITYNFVLR
jgi:TonB family protein